LFKVVATRHGTVSWVRVYQGRLSSGDQVRNSRTGKVERTQGLFRLAGESTESLDEAFAGDVVAVKGLKDITTGDALCSPKHGVELPPWDFPLPVISMAVEARRVQDRDKLMDCLRLLATEDPTMAWRINDDTGQLLVSGMGELHLEILANKLQRDFSLDVALGKPRVAYRESIRQRARVARVVERKLPTREVRVYLDVEFVPVPTDDLPRVTHAIDEGTLDSAQARLLPDIAVESLRADLTAGFAHGFPAIQVHAVVHRLCNDEIPPPSVEDLQATLNSVVRELGKGSDTLLLEPWMAIEAQCPEGFLSSVLGDIQASGGEVHNVEAGPGHATIDARAPLSRMLDFTTRLRSLTQGRGQYSMTLDRYREVSKQDHHRLTGGV
jgi:elongation factor G